MAARFAMMWSLRGMFCHGHVGVMRHAVMVIVAVTVPVTVFWVVDLMQRLRDNGTDPHTKVQSHHVSQNQAGHEGGNHRPIDLHLEERKVKPI